MSPAPGAAERRDGTGSAQGPGTDGGLQEPGPAGGEATGPEDPGPLRAAFGGLTTRGRSFLAAGVAASICAYVLGQADLLRVGMLLTALPLVSVLVLHRTRCRVAGSRRLSPERVPASAESRVRLRVENVWRLPTGLLMLQDRVPYVLGPRPRFVLDRVEPGGRRDVSYRVRSDLRGRYRLGPLQLRLTDPFGMCELLRSFSGRDTLTVVPEVQSLPPGGLSGEAGGYGDGRRSTPALAGDDDVIPRGYRHGDDLRRVHWRSTARFGELMVRREEQPQKARCTVLLDTRRAAYAGSGPGSPFEWAVSGAASAALHFLERGYAVRLLTDTGAMAPGPESGSFGGDTSDTAGQLLDILAVIEHSTGTDLAHACDMLRDSSEGDGLLIAFLGELDEESAVTVGRMRHRTHAAAAFVSVLPGERAAPTGGRVAGAATASPDDAPPLRAMRDAGWTVLLGGPDSELPQLWQEAGARAVKGRAR